jgi:hypothetical protein
MRDDDLDKTEKMGGGEKLYLDPKFGTIREPIVSGSV